MPYSIPPTPERRYRILAQLGQGGMASIKLAMRRGPGGFRKLFVVKQLRQDLANDDYAKMFLHEARLAALLSHPNLVQTYEVGQELDDCFLEMEYLEGQTLARLVRRVKRPELPLEVHLHILAELLAGLSHVHDLQDLAGNPLHVVHRDLSPGNLFLTYDGQIKLLDFGIAQSIELVDLPSVGSIKGKVGYMSPEQAKAGKVDRRSDLYSVGIMLWEAIARRPFVPRGEPVSLGLQKRREGTVVPIQDLCPDVNATLAEICAKALVLDPAKRYQSASEFRDALLQHIQQLPLQPTRESVAHVVGHAFERERAELNAVIAEKIASHESTDEPLIAQALFRGNGSSSVSRHLPPAIESPASEQRSTLSPRWLALGVSSAVGLSLLAFALLARDNEPELRSAPIPATAAVPAPLPAKPAQAQPAPPSAVQFTLRVTPPDALIKLDGETLGRGHVDLSLPKKTGKAELVISRKGYLTARRQLRLDRDQSIELVLEPKADKKKSAPSGSRVRKKTPTLSPNPTPPAAKPQAPKAPADTSTRQRPKAGDELSRPATRQKRSIDKENPYQ